MGVVTWIPGGALLALGLSLIAGSYGRLVHNLLRMRELREGVAKPRGWSSPAPLIGPLAMLAGWALLPVPFTAWILLAFALDPDTALLFPFACIALVRARRGA